MYMCELCDKSFSQSGSRNVHMKGHLLSKSLKKGRPSKSSTIAQQDDGMDSCQNVLFIQQNQDDLYQFGNPDLHGSPCESIIFPHAVTKDVVAVTTQPEGDLDLQNNILGTEEVLGNDECMSSTLPTHTSGANVVVLTQPQEMSSLTTSYHGTQGGKEEIIYQSDLHLTLDHEEMAGNMSLHDLHADEQVHITTASSIAETTHAQSIDPIMEMDGNESDDNDSKLTIMCE
ncbi:uncharacterized protein LOC106166718 [Lingula anatina]|nr:uncharacterized protein LOC106166718 [Lingula anatina]|eukprot:XP_013400815.1 uncharacterized protein LOC106166718 [Lingula anatina]